MTTPIFTDLLQANIQTGLQIALPFLGALLVVGVLVGLIQAATQVSEPSISFLAKLFTLLGLLAAMGPWAMDKAKASFTDNVKAISAYPRPAPSADPPTARRPDRGQK